MSDINLKPEYIKVDGILFPPFPLDHIREALSYKPKADDIFIATYPKCGTTWMQNIVISIFRKGKEFENIAEDFHRCSPFFECRGLQSVESMPRPGAIKTHLPFDRIPYSPCAKYIYVLRNPKDCCVSLYYHTKGAHRGQYADATFENFFELFMAGEVEYNDYFDHTMSWYPHVHDKNVCFTTYEDMKKDTKDVILKVATFLGQDYIDVIQNDNNVLNNILRFCEFDYMKENLTAAFSRCPLSKDHGVQKQTEENPVNVVENKAEHKHQRKGKVLHMRKGIVGDWKNHFSDEQSIRLNKKFTERLQGTGIFTMYKHYMGI